MYYYGQQKTLMALSHHSQLNGPIHLELISFLLCQKRRLSSLLFLNDQSKNTLSLITMWVFDKITKRTLKEIYLCYFDRC